ncbi:MAG: hypothetical protein ACKOPQ_01960 [Novosphingobium sp.]
MFAPRLAPIALGLMALSACSGGKDESQKPVDPAVSAALAGPLLTEPDLAGLNGAARALSGSGVASAPIPANLFTPESADAARAEAKALLGGAIQPAPASTSTEKAASGETALMSLRAAFGKSPCESGLGWSAIWATRLPDPVIIYPRGHVAEAVGSDSAGCTLRAVTFRSGVALGDLVDFYWTRASRAGFTPLHRADGDAHAISAAKGGLSFTVFVKPGPDGQSEVHLVTKGG